jgi:hypothetical protein
MGGVGAKGSDCAAENMGIHKSMQTTPAIVADRNNCMAAPPDVRFKIDFSGSTRTAQLVVVCLRRERLMAKTA